MKDFLRRVRDAFRRLTGARDPSQPRYEVRREPGIRFLHEQDGEAERRVKSALLPVFLRHAGVARAYLVHADYGMSKDYEVVLCLVAPEDPGLVKEVSAVFSTLAPRNVHLDVLFLDDAKERELSQVCVPFYPAGRPVSSEAADEKTLLH